MHLYFTIRKDGELSQQIALNCSSDISCVDFMNLHKKMIAKPYSLLVINTTPESDNPLRLGKNPLETI